MELMANIADQHGASWAWDGNSFWVLNLLAHSEGLETWEIVGSVRELMHWLGY
jgi:hypothetical protein